MLDEKITAQRLSGEIYYLPLGAGTGAALYSGAMSDDFLMS